MEPFNLSLWAAIRISSTTLSLLHRNHLNQRHNLPLKKVLPYYIISRLPNLLFRVNLHSRTYFCQGISQCSYNQFLQSLHRSLIRSIYTSLTSFLSNFQLLTPSSSLMVQSNISNLDNGIKLIFSIQFIKQFSEVSITL